MIELYVKFPLALHQHEPTIFGTHVWEAGGLLFHESLSDQISFELRIVL